MSEIADHTSVDSEERLRERFAGFIETSGFPCVGAKSALARHQLRMVIARDIRSSWNDLPIHSELHAFAQAYKADPRLFQSFAVLFQGPLDLSEAEYEACMWERLRSLTAKDVWQGTPPDPRVSTAPDSPHFSLSFGGEAFFAVGLHPNASRDARRFSHPAIVFNLHDQFERLRTSGTYEKLRGAILSRDEDLQGSTNPMLMRYGEVSEAAQYSGRHVGDDWRAPIQERSAAARQTSDIEDLLK